MQLRDETAGGIACRKCAKNADSVALAATNWNSPNFCSSALISEYGTCGIVFIVHVKRTGTKNNGRGFLENMDITKISVHQV